MLLIIHSANLYPNSEDIFGLSAAIVKLTTYSQVLEYTVSRFQGFVMIIGVGFKDITIVSFIEVGFIVTVNILLRNRYRQRDAS